MEIFDRALLVLIKQRDDATRDLAIALGERDEARDQLNRTRQDLEDVVQDRYELQALEMSHEGACVRLKRERDEARAKLAVTESLLETERRMRLIDAFRESGGEGS